MKNSTTQKYESARGTKGLFNKRFKPKTTNVASIQGILEAIKTNIL